MLNFRFRRTKKRIKLLLNPSKEILGFDDRIICIIGIVLNTHGAMAIYYTGSIFTTDFFTYCLKWSEFLLIVTVLWLVTRAMYLALVKRFPGSSNRVKRWVRIPFFLIPFAGISLLFVYYIRPLFNIMVPGYPEPHISIELITGSIITMLDIGVYEGIHMYTELKNSKIKEETLKKEHLTSKLASLQNQISPHFLFNSLNTLVYLIDTDKDKGIEFVHKLAYIYKCVLESSEKEFVTLKEELNYINAYTELLIERFGTNLTVDFEIAPNERKKKIVPLAMQLGIENAVKHNIISIKKPLNIAIATANDYLIIKNNLQKREVREPHLGLGLKNIVNRYSLLTNREVVVETNSSDFILKLPLLNR
ncbi:histidine kinase [Flagellimonas sp. DF-77]|uniref:sensor histidine kinase n=1 Tax=Flagellimonas algarum TaxID=3230298 RepID=UPI0033956CDB